MELKSVHRRYLANMISLFALNSLSRWLIFASFGNLCRSFSRNLTKLEKTFLKNYVQKFPRIS